MNQLRFVKDYKHDDLLRKNYCEFAQNIFGISFEEYYEKGFWGARYISFSYIKQNTVVANVSVNVLDLVMEVKFYL